MNVDKNNIKHNFCELNIFIKKKINKKKFFFFCFFFLKKNYYD